MDHIDQAIYDTIHNSTLPAKEIALRLGLNHQVLLNKANPQCESHKLGFREAIAIQMLTRNTRMCRAMVTELEIEQTPSPYDCILSAFLAASKEHGDVSQAIYTALEDGRVTLREKERICKEIEEAQERLEQLKRTVVEHQPGKSLKAVS